MARSIIYQTLASPENKSPPQTYIVLTEGEFKQKYYPLIKYKTAIQEKRQEKTFYNKAAF